MLQSCQTRSRGPSGRAASPFQPFLRAARHLSTAGTQIVEARAALDTKFSPISGAEMPSTSKADSDAAWELLRDFTLKEFRGQAQDAYLSSPAKRQCLRDALRVAFSGPHPYAGWMGPSPDSEVILGVVASDTKFVARAYRDWCEELGLNLVAPTCRVDGVTSAMQLRGGVYLKYNSKTQLCYVSRYDGRDRGVLLQLGQVQLGHFPLGFFDEDMAKPPPSF